MKMVILSVLVGITVGFGLFLSEGIMYSLTRYSYFPAIVLAHIIFYGGISIYWKCLQWLRRWAHS